MHGIQDSTIPLPAGDRSGWRVGLAGRHAPRARQAPHRGALGTCAPPLRVQRGDPQRPCSCRAQLSSAPFWQARKALLLWGQGHCDRLETESTWQQRSPLTDPSLPALTSQPCAVGLRVLWPQRDQRSPLQHLLQGLPQGDIYHLHPSSSCPTTSLRFVHNVCFQLSTFIVPPMCTFRGHLGGSNSYSASTTLSLQDRPIRAPRQCHRAHQPRRQHRHRQAGQAGRGEAGHRHGALCSAGYSTTSPYLFLLTSAAAPPLSSGLGRFSATERTRSLDP